MAKRGRAQKAGEAEKEAGKVRKAPKTAPKRVAPAPVAQVRTSSRERKGPASYCEEKLEAFVHEREQTGASAAAVTVSAGGAFFKYSPPCDPPGMKSTAYNCKYPAVKGPVAEVLPAREPLPTRNAAGELCFADKPHFRPNLTPAQVLKDGAFGGTYFRKITSAVTGEPCADQRGPGVAPGVWRGGCAFDTCATSGETYQDVHKEFPEEWFKGLPAKTISNSKYRADINKWGVECGGALDMWESSGWISNLDPYGWFQW